MDMKEKRILLLVDDEETIFKTMKMLFSEKTYTILYCKDINCAYSTLKAQRVDLMILDLFLPHGSGLRLLEKINKKGISVKTVMLSASDTAQSATEAMKLGAIDYFTKPFKTKEFVKKIKSYIAQGEN